MKNSLLLFGGLLLLINTSAGIVFSSYNAFNIGLADFSIILTTVLIYLLYNNSSNPDGFKIGFTLFFALTGFGRFVCSLLSTNQMDGNIAIFVFIILLAFEGLSLFVAGAMKDK